MILEIAPEQMFEVPVDADFTLRFRTSFTAQQMATASVLQVEYEDPDDIRGAFTAQADGADMILLINPGMLRPGLWDLNPVFILGSKKYVWPLAAGMLVLDRGVSRTPSPRQGSVAFQ